MSPPAEPTLASRRGALWPWLVTPLVTLALFYVLLHLQRTAVPAAAAGTVVDEGAALTPER
jgi:hypothetical protein